MNQYDYLISGSGAAGMSLLMRFLSHPAFSNKRILVVDNNPKNSNDHTWCFWEKQSGMFENVVHHKWDRMHFFSESFSSLLDLSPFTYKMIRSIEFYNYVRSEASKHTNVEFLTGNIEAAGNEGNNAILIVDGKKYSAPYVFNSVLFEKPQPLPGQYQLQQHFKGFVIETTEPLFDEQVATLMDFRVSQHNGTSFVYVLPVARNRALVEYTLFSKDLLKQDEYVTALRDYIATFLQIEDYTIAEEEFGIIPMTNYRFVGRVGNVINIGTAGGQTKASSGYTFQFIQKHSDKIVADLLQFGEIRNSRSLFKKRFNLYDSTLLNVLSEQKLPGDRIFATLFSKNPTDRVLRFLDNESDLQDEINLMATLPQGVFMKAAFQELLK